MDGWLLWVFGGSAVFALWVIGSYLRARQADHELWAARRYRQEQARRAIEDAEERMP